MSITPAELRHVRFEKVRKGYDTDAVDRAMENVADSIEALLHERHELHERITQLEADTLRLRESQGSLAETLTLAERAANELRAEAQAEADKILAAAQHQMQLAQQALQQAQARPAVQAPPTSALPDPAFIELLGETRAIRSLLQALLTQGAGDQQPPFAPRAQ